MQYRIYASGTLVHEDDFEEYDNAQPYYDDYGTYDIPEEVECHLTCEEDTFAYIDYLANNGPRPAFVTEMLEEGGQYDSNSPLSWPA